jgi:cell division septation protein DedD
MPKSTVSFEEKILTYVSTAPIDAVEVTLKFANAAFKGRRARQTPSPVMGQAQTPNLMAGRKKPGPKPGTTRKGVQTATQPQSQPVATVTVEDADAPIAQAGD